MLSLQLLLLNEAIRPYIATYETGPAFFASAGSNGTFPPRILAESQEKYYE